MKSELMLLQLHNALKESKNISTRRAAILKVHEQNKTHLSIIKQYLKVKYSLDEVNQSTLTNAQNQQLYSEISKKIIHEKLYKCKDNAMVSIKDSYAWLKFGNNKPRAEANFCYIQDRNIFWGSQSSMCPHCGNVKKSVDHLATKCDRMPGHDYTRRHNEVLRCLHLLLMNKYNFKKSNKIRTHSVQEVMTNEYAEIKVDTRIKTDILVKNNRPDIYVYDKKAGEIILIKVGITNQDILQSVENEKKRKYDLLANEPGLLYKAKTRIIVYVMTWDGVVTKYHRSHYKELGITPTIEVYIQSLVLKKTLEAISLEHRRSIKDLSDRESAREEAIEKLCESKTSQKL